MKRDNNPSAMEQRHKDLTICQLDEDYSDDGNIVDTSSEDTYDSTDGFLVKTPNKNDSDYKESESDEDSSDDSFGILDREINEEHSDINMDLDKEDNTINHKNRIINVTNNNKQETGIGGGKRSTHNRRKPTYQDFYSKQEMEDDPSEDNDVVNPLGGDSSASSIRTNDGNKNDSKEDNAHTTKKQLTIRDTLDFYVRKE